MGRKKKKEVVRTIENSVILGLDVSTTTIGISIGAYINGELKILEITHIKFGSGKKYKGTKGLFLKSLEFREMIGKYKDYNITNAVIEEPLFGSNNAITVGVLLRFNGMISQHVFDVLGIVPEFISSYNARKFGFPELNSVRKYNKRGEEYTVNKIRLALKHSDIVEFGAYSWDVSKKEILWGLVSDMYPDIKWQYNKKGELKNENFDATDSLVCILGFINMFNYKSKEPKVIEYNETKTKDGVYFTYKVDFCGKVMEKALLLND